MKKNADRGLVILRDALEGIAYMHSQGVSLRQGMNFKFDYVLSQSETKDVPKRSVAGSVR